MIETGKDKYEENIVWTDSTFFNLFSIPLIEGRSNDVLNKPRTAVISQTTSRKYFGDKSPVGERIKITWDDDYYTITGVYEDIPENSHFHFDILMTLVSWDDPYMNSWGSNNYLTYLKLHQDADPRELSEKLSNMIRKYNMHIAK